MSTTSDEQQDRDDGEWEAAVEERDAAPARARKSGTPANARAANIENLRDDGGGRAGDGEPNLEGVLDIPVTLAVEIGRTRISIRNLLQLNQGSVVELDRLAGESLDVMINGTLVAHGEVVVVNEKFGIRLTDVISAQERVHKLR